MAVKITDRLLATIREQVDLVDLVRAHERVLGRGLRKRGKFYVGSCPFLCPGGGVFLVERGLGLWHCRCCGRGGDAIRYVMDVEQIDFTAAVTRLATVIG